MNSTQIAGVTPREPDPIRFAVPADVRSIALRLPDGSSHPLQLGGLADDAEERHDLAGQPVVLRRVFCVIRDGLLRSGEGEWALSPSTRAALLWRAYRRYAELVGLKRLGGGLSGSAVLVFRPRLKVPLENPLDPDLASAGPTDVLRGAWGSPLLVKAGRASDLRQEWTRSERFLRDRQSPFVARIEEFLTVHPVHEPADESVDAPEPQGVLVSSFLGGDVVRAEPLDKVIRGTRDADRCLRLLDQIAGHLATWHTNPTPRPLAEWPRVFRFAGALPPDGFDPETPAAPWLLFGQFDLRKSSAQAETAGGLRRPDGQPALGREEFAEFLRWDPAFWERAHLQDHLLGRSGRADGLLPRLMAMPAQFSLVHGDLNPRNVLCDADRTWLIDFQHTGVGPVLADFARLEVNLRLWCIDLRGSAPNATEAALELERVLLDHFHGSESSLEPILALAPALGADPDDLLKVARCVTHLRRLARRWCAAEFVDGRDYLAVQYLTLLGLIRYASLGHVPAPNLQWAVGLFWALEEALDRLLDRLPFPHGRPPYHPLRQVSADWLRGGGAVGRVHAFCETAGGREAVQPLVGLRGVLQGPYHHLDAYQHTLAVLGYMEALLDDPLGGLRNPAALDAAVARQQEAAGLPRTAIPQPQAAPSAPPDGLTDADRDAVERLLAECLTGDARLLLKWCAVLHDVGKRDTRSSRIADGAEQVHFIGHEVFGLTLLRERLAVWFPAARERLADLIRHHHRGHQLVGALGDGGRDGGGRGERLRRLLAGGRDGETLRWLVKMTDPESGECRPDLPLLLLHGYADRLAARGVRQSQPVAEWAEATLLLLAALARLPELVTADEAAKDQEKVIAAAALRYAEELRTKHVIDPKWFGRAMAILREEAAAQTGTAEELDAFLRATFPPDELARRLREGQ